MNPAAVKTWLGPDRCTALTAQTEGRFENILEGVCKKAPDIPTAGIWTLQQCGSAPTPADTARWTADTTPVRDAAKKAPAKKAAPAADPAPADPAPVKP